MGAGLLACAGPALAQGIDLKRLLTPLPISLTATSAAPITVGTNTSRATAALSAENIESGRTPASQLLGAAGGSLSIKAYTVTHMRAADVQQLLADPLAPLLPREGSAVVVDARSNTLLVKGTEAEHQLTENLLRRVDVPARQILVEVKIVSADEYFGKSLGARFGITGSHLLNVATPRQKGGQFGASLDELNQIANKGTSTFPNSVNLPATNTLTGAAVSSFALGLFKLPAGINIGLEISALEEAGHTKVLSSPRLVLSNQRPGLISSGQRIPYSKPSSVQGVNVTEFVDVKVSVAVTALVSPDGTISMELTLVDDSVGSSNSAGPTINTNQATSQVTLKNGETLVLGGFQSSAQIEERNQTPVLGDLPVLGNLFRSRSQTATKRELLFIITPTVIHNGAEG